MPLDWLSFFAGMSVALIIALFAIMFGAAIIDNKAQRKQQHGDDADWWKRGD